MLAKTLEVLTAPEAAFTKISWRLLGVTTAAMCAQSVPMAVEPVMMFAA